MVILGGLGSFFIGASLQSAMPVFASQVGARDVGAAYGVLLFATGVGGVVGGLLLEATGWIKPNVKAALVSTSVYGLAILGFAITHNYLLAVILLLTAGVASLISMSIGQTIVQLEAPPAERGRVLGVYAMSASGLRAGSGFTVGLLGAAVGLNWSLGLSAAALCVGTLLAAVYALRRPA
jgi:MFS family permease